MNTKRSVRWILLAGAAVSALLAATPGCELLVDFDRSKIPVDASIGDDGALTDASTSPVDGSLLDSGDAGAGSDATVPVTDAASEAAVADASVPPDTGVAPVDASVDAPLDVAVIPDTGAPVDEASVPDAANE
jgi:hypothetical protein